MYRSACCLLASLGPTARPSAGCIQTGRWNRPPLRFTARATPAAGQRTPVHFYPRPPELRYLMESPLLEGRQECRHPQDLGQARGPEPLWPEASVGILRVLAERRPAG